MRGKRFIHSTVMLLVPVMFICFNSSPGAAQNYLGSLKVQVKDFYTGKPLSGATILVTPNNYTGTSNAQGEAVIEKITPFRNYQLTVKCSGYVLRETAFVIVRANEETTAVAPLKKNAVIRGFVRQPGALLPFLRRPLPGAEVFLLQQQGDQLKTITVAKANGFGYFSLVNIDEGTYTIVALKDGYKQSDVLEIQPASGKFMRQNFVLEKPQVVPDPIQVIITDPQKPYTAPVGYFFGIENAASFKTFYWVKEQQPAGAVPMGEEGYFGPPPGSVYYFTLPMLGQYTISAYAVDESGAARRGSITFEAGNVPPTAVPSVIPGPTELPLIDKDILFADSSGASSVAAGSTVYLRGFGTDLNTPSPEEFNIGSPTFDVYGNKNGDFHASIFDFAWTLKDKNGNDVSSLLSPSAAQDDVSFNIPADAQPGDSYTATLIMTDDKGAQSAPQSLEITVADIADAKSCSTCHSDKALGYAATAHANKGGGATCQSCHGKGSIHVAGSGSPKLSVNYWSGVCGQCHEQFAETQKAMHTNALPFGYYEPTGGRLASCYRCHYTKGYIGAVASDKPFQEFRYPFSPLPDVPKDTPNVSCSVCHDSHRAEKGNPVGLRTGAPGKACDTCHYEKWQNAILEGMAGEVGNGYHYPGQDYSAFEGDKNPHRREDKCVMCHMSTKVSDKDAQKVRKVGGHTFRMRDYGDDLIPGTADDTLNIPVCQGCHAGLTSFDRNGVQTEVKGLLTELSSLLKGNNHEFLPANQPGKCARCHKGGTVPFLNDQGNILEHAYTNYKLFVNDRSYGIHNPGYTRKLLQDSIDSVKQLAR
ncbi:MAG: hypothetical protein NTV89_02310 [Proteobacteria bacterium]|nr:hypothetical protein [Pseudomonadota bacterium]